MDMYFPIFNILFSFIVENYIELVPIFLEKKICIIGSEVFANVF